MRSPAPACHGAYALRPPEHAFLLMQACACTSINEKNVDTLYIFLNLLDILHRLSPILAFYVGFNFFAIFNLKLDDVIYIYIFFFFCS